MQNPYNFESYIPPRLTAAELQKEREKGKHILLVMHDLTAALDLADRVLLLDGGKLAFDGTPTACLDARIPERVFGLTRYRATDEKQNEVYFFKA